MIYCSDDFLLLHHPHYLLIQLVKKRTQILQVLSVSVETVDCVKEGGHFRTFLALLYLFSAFLGSSPPISYQISGVEVLGCAASENEKL